MKQININKLILSSGIGLYLLGFVATLIGILIFNKPSDSQQPVLEILTFFPPLIVFAFTTIYASIFEEIAFRSWIIKKKIWKYISLAAIVGFMYLAFENIIVSIIAGGILFVVFFKIKNEKLKLLLSVLITSIFFGLIHFANYSEWSRSFAIIQIIGFSFIICYLGLRFGFIFCIIGHFINNLLVMLMFTVFISTDYSGEFSNETYSAEISKVSLFNLSDEYYYMDYDTINYIDNITKIAVSLAPFENSTIYRNQISSLIKCRLNAVANEDYYIDKNELLTDFLQHTGLKTDTTYEPAYILFVNDTARLKNPSISDKNTYNGSIISLTSSIRNIYKAPVILKEYQYNYDFLLYLGLFNSGLIIDHKKAFADFKAKLEDEYGIELIADSTKMATIITFKE